MDSNRGYVGPEPRLFEGPTVRAVSALVRETLVQGGTSNNHVRYWPTVLVPELLARTNDNEALRAQPEPPTADPEKSEERFEWEEPELPL